MHPYKIMAEVNLPGPSQVDYAAYVRHHILSDIAANRNLTGKSYHVELAAVLISYLQHPEDEDDLIALGLKGVSMLEREIEAETGMKVAFHQTKKCALAVYELWASENQEGLEELRKFADTLVRSSLEPEDIHKA